MRDVASSYSFAAPLLLLPLLSLAGSSGHRELQEHGGAVAEEDVGHYCLLASALNSLPLSLVAQ